MDISKIMKMDNSQLQSEIGKCKKKIETLKSEISLLRRLMNANPENGSSQKTKNGFFENGNRFSEIPEEEINEMISPDFEADFKAQP